MTPPLPRPPVRFGSFEVDLAAGHLRKQGVRIKLQEQPFQALVALIERPGEVLSREDLQKRLWPANTTVDFDRGLNKAIGRLRDALGDDPENPRFIETLPQHGYRFLARLEAPQAEPAREIASIAVLPLENLSGDPAQEYFSDGMTDELISQIASATSLRVTSRTSSMRYKGESRKSLPVIANELNVDAILEGTVTQAGGKVRITAQLIWARDDRHLWSQRYERDLTDVLRLQSEVAHDIAGQIQIQLPARQHPSVPNRPIDPAAYEAFLKGNYFLHKAMHGLDRSIQFFTEAIRLDPLQAESYAGLAQALCYIGVFGLRASPETCADARIYAQKALQLDPFNASAHNVLAEVSKVFDWDLAAAVTEYQRALQLNPSHLLTRLWYAECLTRMGMFSEAFEESDRALLLDPVSPISHTHRAMLFWRARQYDPAIQASQQALELDPTFVNALWWQGLSQAGKGEFLKSIACLTKAIQLHDGPLFRALLGHVYALSGEKAKALGMLEEIVALSKQGFVSPVDYAIVYAGLGDADSTFHWLEKAFQARVNRVHELPWMYFDRVRADPRHSDLMRRAGLPA